MLIAKSLRQRHEAEGVEENEGSTLRQLTDTGEDDGGVFPEG
jgi:hypothetical protein